jgi:tetratricopeptide (TPR) repeat protein
MPGIESLVSLCTVLNLDSREILECGVSPMELSGDVAGSSIAELERRVAVLYWNGQFRATAVLCAALLARIETERSSEPTERQRLCVRMELGRAGALRRCGRFQAAEAAARRGLFFAARNVNFQAESLLTLARVHTSQAVYPLARATSDQAVRLASGGGSPRVLAFAWAAKAGCLYATAQFEESAEACRRARDFSVLVGDECVQAGAEGTLGSCLLDLGHPRAALMQYARAVELARRGGDRNGEACWQLERGRVAVRLEALDDAERSAAAGLRIARTGDNPFALFRGIWLQHQIARRRNSLKPDGQRVAYLKRLYPRVAGEKNMDVIREFRLEILGLEGA